MSEDVVSMADRSGYERALALAKAACDRADDDVTPERRDALMRRLEADDRAARARMRFVDVVVGLLLGIGVFNIAAPGWTGRTCALIDRVHVAMIVGLPGAAVALALVLLRRPGVGGQMLARALLWSTALAGAQTSVLEPTAVPLTSAAAAVLCGAALLVLREHGLEPERYVGRFAPIGHRGVLTLTIIVAVGDAETLLAWANGSLWHAWEAGLCGFAMMLGVIGLARLELWGLLLSTAMGVAVTALGAAGLLGLPMGVIVFLAISGAAQIVLAAVVLRSVRRGTVAEWPLLSRWGAPLVWFTIALAMATGAAGWFGLHVERGHELVRAH